MTVWLFDDGSSLSTVANGSDSVTYNISSSSTSDTGSYYCIATTDEMNDTSDVYALFGESLLYYVLYMIVYLGYTNVCNFNLFFSSSLVLVL